MSKSNWHLFVDDGWSRSWDRSCEAATSASVIRRWRLAGVSRSWQSLYTSCHPRGRHNIVWYQVSVEVRSCCCSVTDLNTAFRACKPNNKHTKMHTHSPAKMHAHCPARSAEKTINQSNCNWIDSKYTISATLTGHTVSTPLNSRNSLTKTYSSRNYEKIQSGINSNEM